MSNKKINNFGFLPAALAMLLITLLSISFFSGCGSADATGKKDKSKKAKAKRDLAVEDETEPEAETDEKTEEKPADNNSLPADENKKSPKPSTEADKNPADKKDGNKNAKKESVEKETTEKVQKIPAESVWADLMRGNQRFMAGKHTPVNYSSARRQLVKGQKPQAIILGCADSRVPPEFVFDKNLGELFVIREAGNIADEISLGSIEYAVEHLHAGVLIVLGHESCGAVAAAVSGEKMPTKNLRSIVESITPAFDGSKTCLIGGTSNLSCVELNVRQSAEDILMSSPIIEKAVRKGELTIIRAVYHMETGEVSRL